MNNQEIVDAITQFAKDNKKHMTTYEIESLVAACDIIDTVNLIVKQAWLQR